MTVHRVRQARRELARAPERAEERAQLLAEAPRRAAPEPHVQVAALAEHPAIALEIRREVELGDVGLDVERRLLARRHGKLELLRRDHGGRVARRRETPRHRAEVAAGADQQRRLEGAVYAPEPVPALERAQTCSRAQRRLGACEQVVVELAAPDPVADRAAERGAALGVADPPHAKALDRLERAAARVLGGIDRERLEHGRRDPAGARLVAGKGGAIEHADGRARAREAPGQRRAGRAASHHDHVETLHQALAYQLARVQGIRSFALRVNTSWYRCSEAVSNEAAVPARYRCQARAVSR